MNLLDQFQTLIPDGEDVAITIGGGRAYIFNRQGTVISLKLREGEPLEETRFRLTAALAAAEISSN